MAGKDIHSEVEGHAMKVKAPEAAQVEGQVLKWKRAEDAEAPADTDLTSEAVESDGAEVEGHASRFNGGPAEQPAQVEGHAGKWGRAEDEAPSEDEATADESREPESGEDEVEGHPFRR